MEWELKMQTIISSGFYKSTITVGGWAIYETKGPFHRHRAKMIAHDCELKALEILHDEEIQDKTNVIYNDTYTLKD